MLAADISSQEIFGRAVAVSGNTAVVASRKPASSSPEIYRGAVYIFERNAGGANNWGEVKKIIAADGAASDWFGFSVSADGDNFLVGAHLATVVQPFAENKSLSGFLPPVQQGAGYVFRGAVVSTPTAASVSVGGRVMSADGRGIARAQVLLTDVHGETRIVVTNAFGYYRFSGVAAGETYVFSVRTKRFEFVPQAITVIEEINNLDFTAK